MSTDSITIKQNNHRIHLCAKDRKIELLNHLISKNSSSNIIVVASVDAKGIKDSLENQEIVVMSDKEFITNKELTCEMLISFDIPQKAIIYSARIAKVTDKAITLVDENEQTKLYQIEMFLGRAIKQEIVKGFEYEQKKEEEKPKYPARKMTRDQIKDEAKKRYEKNLNSDEKPKFDKPKKEFKSDKKPYNNSKRDNSKDNRWAKKDKKPNKFLGKDENGKAIFSGKSGERNHHYDGTPKDRFSKPKKVGRKIQIKALKEKKQ